jgi:Domain of unknown function (DUF305)
VGCRPADAVVPATAAASASCSAVKRRAHPPDTSTGDPALRRLQGLLALQGLSPHAHSHQQADGRNQTDLERLSRLRGAALDLELLEVLAARERAGVAMAAAELRHGTRPEVRGLARGLLAGQRADVRQLDAWRDAWAEPASASRER